MTDQATASSTPRPHQLATFIFDPLLPRSRYTQLIQLDGVVHAVVKRLLEKHQTDSHLRLEAIVPSLLPCPSRKRPKDREQRTGYVNATTLMMRLPIFKPSFSESSECLAGDNVSWPAFGDATKRAGEGGSRKRKRQAEVGLMDGVVTGLEALRSAAEIAPTATIPDLLSSLCPSEARPLMTALHTPPSPPPPSNTHTISKYLFVFAYERRASPTRVNESENWTPIVQTSRRDVEWDQMGWDEISSQCRDDGVRVSLVISEEDEEAEGPAKKRLKGFMQNISPDTTTSAWFSLPPKTYAHFSSLSLPSSSTPVPLPNPAVNRSSPAGAGNPSLASLDSPSNTSQNSMNPHQALAMRFLAQRNSGSAPSGPLPGQLSNQGVSAALANFMSAARNGNVDPNDPQMTQFKQMIMLQQQMQNGQKDGDQLSAAQQKQKVVMAMQAMQAAQQQAAANKAAAQAQASAQTQAQAQASGSGSSGKATIWSGEIAWPVQNSSTGEARLSVECTTANNGSVADPSQLANLLPRELRITSSMQADSAFLQSFVREHKTPVLHFGLSSDSLSDPVLTKRFESLINGLSSKGTVGVVRIGGNDRGILLCTAPGSMGQIPRLLGVLCMTVPLPNAPNRQPPPHTLPPSQFTSNPPLRSPQIDNQMQSDLPAPYNKNQQQHQPSQPSQQSFPQQMQSNQPMNAMSNPAQAAMPPINVTPDQLRALLVQASRLGIELPPDIDPTKLTQNQIRMLLQTVKMKNMQRQHMMMQQQQMQQGQGQGGGGGMGTGGIDPRLMPGGNIDPRLMSGTNMGGNQLDLQQFQQSMGQGGGGDLQGMGYGGGQYPDGRQG